MKPFEDRYQSMFKPGSRAKDVQALIAETNELLAASKVAEQTARETAVDPATSDEDAATARSDADGHAFAIERLQIKRDRLQERLEELTGSERAQAGIAEYQEVAAEHGALVDEIRETVPAIFDGLMRLFERIDANDARLEAANRGRPTGAPALISSELVARGAACPFWPPANVIPVERLTRMKLPNFARQGTVWPVEKHFDFRGADDEAKRRAREVKASYEAQWGSYRISHLRGRAIQFRARVAPDVPAETARMLYQSIFTGQLRHAEAERLRGLGVSVEALAPDELDEALEVAK